MWYLASPFFNPAQIVVVDKIEQLFKGQNIALFSPRAHPANSTGKPIDANTAPQIFLGNLTGIAEATGVLAVMDYSLPEEEELRIISYAPKYPSVQCEATEAFGLKSGPLNLPDSGTVWEMGYAYGLDKKIVGFTTADPGQGRLNLMLTQSCTGVLCGFDQLERWVKSGCALGMVPEWAGKLI